ncbi:MAG: hypothetical protein NXY57DRAFT_901446 [Lentinula lateritia]|uniref:sn-1-specific diacylglycerol lipase n=1 Tax=Lentinula lateritia TaxID=40482 RepID=A0ABQ8VI39_9AGAR|nr:MAG: hypothetical protein NXY57DRAFT_901446 [Lentinula lateritia]KAJ4491728.1 hypothetical protein C8R41DRAFT_833886 [Lentinula lateritia]
MVKNWDTYTRQGLDLVSSAASIGFSVAKTGTKIGFALTRGIASTTVGISATVVDAALFGGVTVTRPVVGGAVSAAIGLVEQLTLVPIHLGEYLTSTSVIAAHSSINLLSAIFPGSHEASFSLASFITLVKREWAEPIDGENLPEKQFGVTSIARAVSAWAALQGVTQEWQERRWFKYLKEIDVKNTPKHFDSLRNRKGSRVRVTSDVIFPGNLGQLVAADIGEAPKRAQSISISNRVISSLPNIQVKEVSHTSRRLSNTELKVELRRLSKMVLAGYGGASLLFFGIPLSSSIGGNIPSTSPQAKAEEAQLANAVNASEAEAEGDGIRPEIIHEEQYSWWDVLLGRHDHDILAKSANDPNESIQTEIKIGREHLMPRFWVLTDHSRAQVVLILRGTMSLNEIAVDLSCESEEFEPASTANSEALVPGQYDFSRRASAPSIDSSITPKRYLVHSGMLRMARAMGDVGKPVHLAVHEALQRNPDYGLVMCGHSLGAGVAALLGLMWADPKTCLTVHSSGLPIDRQVSVYCFAPPALTDASLSKLADGLIVSFVYSHDVVSRLSLGSVRDLKNAASWLCEANESHRRDAGYSEVTARASNWKAGKGSADDPHWFIAVRKTLEANMRMSHTFPPGRILWALRESDLHPSHRIETSKILDKLRLFEVLDVAEVFSQIVFAKDMLGAHLPHKYDSVLHDLL